MEEKENANVTFLNLIISNAKMGIIGIDAVLDRVESSEILKIIKEQRAEYDNIIHMGKKLLTKYGVEEEAVSVKEVTSKIMSKIMVSGSDDKKIVKMMMEGNEKGVIAITQRLNEYEDKDHEIVKLAKKLLATEEHNRDEFKQYL